MAFQVALNNWWEGRWGSVAAIYEDRHEVWGIGPGGQILRRSLPGRRAAVSDGVPLALLPVTFQNLKHLVHTISLHLKQSYGHLYLLLRCSSSEGRQLACTAAGAFSVSVCFCKLVPQPWTTVYL
jgi:hypothetical protein